jgi:hypothetical protein
MSKHIDNDDTVNTGRRSMMKGTGLAVAAMSLIPAVTATQAAAQTSSWDKVFPKSDNVDHQKVSFKNRYGIALSGDLYLPKNRGSQSLPALAIGGPFGAVKEQSSGLYAQTMAERGFAALAFDPSFTGESGGEPRNVASPDINTEDFSAAVDYLGLQSFIDRERIGVIGICGWGGMALNAVAVDKRVKAVVATTMYDMTRVMSKGYNDSVTLEQRTQALEQMSRQRWADAEKKTPDLPARLTMMLQGWRGSVPDRLPRILHDAARLPSACGQLGQCLDANYAAVVHEHADPDLHRGNLATPAPVRPWRKRPFAIL